MDDIKQTIADALTDEQTIDEVLDALADAPAAEDTIKADFVEEEKKRKNSYKQKRAGKHCVEIAYKLSCVCFILGSVGIMPGAVIMGLIAISYARLPAKYNYRDKRTKVSVILSLSGMIMGTVIFFYLYSKCGDFVDFIMEYLKSHSIPGKGPTLPV